MLLKSLEIQGFKSFPDKTRLGFGPGITAVVGPNGSGKSNISDAIRWVLGEQSSKALRGGRMEDVIFGGTVLRRAQGFAEVSLTIDNRPRTLLLDEDEVTVTRRYYRSGESEYLLNGSEVRLRDVYEMFMDTGLGRDGYSIIGQGRIAEIVGAKSEDRREIFEEAAGISKFRYRKEESERRLKAAEENLVRLHDILSELEARVGPLKEQSEKAARYLALSEERKTLEIGFWLYTLDRQRDALRENDNRISLIRQQHEQIEQAVEGMEKEIEASYFTCQKMAAETEEKRGRAASLEEQALREESSAELLGNDRAHNAENAERIRGEIDETRRTQEQSKQELEAQRASAARAALRAQEFEAQIGECEAQMSGLAEQGEQVSGRLSELERSLSEINVRLSRLGADAAGHRAALMQMGQRSQAVEQGLAEKAQALAGVQEQLREQQAAREACAQRLVELRNTLSGYEMKLQSRAGKLKAAEEEERRVSLALSEKTQRAGMLRDMEKHYEGFAGSVRAVMNEKERGGLRGIHGPVSRLLRVPPKYAVAVETALGGALQNIVTDNEENAKAAIAMLKRTDAGRATFLPLTSVKGNELNEDFSGTAGCEGVASRLIGFDPTYAGVMRSLLGRTLVARDLDSAVAIARSAGYRFRIVTLDGQLVNAGGSLTGGSLNRRGGLLTRPGEIERLEKEAAELREKLQAVTEGKKAVQAEVASLTAGVSGARGQTASSQEEGIRLEGEEKRLSGIAASLSDEVKTLEEEKRTSQAAAAELQDQLERAGRETEELNARAAELGGQSAALGGGRESIREQREALSQKLTALRLSQMAGNKDIEALEAGIRNLGLLLSGHGEKVEGLEESLRALARKDEEAGHEQERLRKEAARLRGQAEEERAGAEELAASARQEEGRTVQLRAREKELSADREKVSQELARLEERRASAQAEYDGIIARLWDEYELTRSEAEKVAPVTTEPQKAQRRIAEIKNEVKGLGSVNVGAIDEYKEVSERYEFLGGQIADVEKSSKELRDLIADLTAKMREIFSEQFQLIDQNFSHTFKELFGGGSAKLVLTEPEDVLSSGIEISVQPPGKIIKNLAALSGGEQAFVAIALYFAILKVRPSPFCVLDEIEAALDDVNVARFAEYLHKMSDRTQFIVITHRRGTMDGADVLYGVTMQEEGVSRLLTLNVAALAEEFAAGA